MSEVCVLKKVDHLSREARSTLYVALKCYFLSIEAPSNNVAKEENNSELNFLATRTVHIITLTLEVRCSCDLAILTVENYADAEEVSELQSKHRLGRADELGFFAA